MNEVEIQDPPSMNLLGLILGSIIRRNLTRPACRRSIEKLSGDVSVCAGEMAVTLRFEPGKVEILRGASSHPRAQVLGALDGLVGMALGKGIIGAVLRGKIRIAGNPLVLLKVRRLLVAGK